MKKNKILFYFLSILWVPQNSFGLDFSLLFSVNSDGNITLIPILFAGQNSGANVSIEAPFSVLDYEKMIFYAALCAKFGVKSPETISGFIDSIHVKTEISSYFQDPQKTLLALHRHFYPPKIKLATYGVQDYLYWQWIARLGISKKNTLYFDQIDITGEMKKKYIQTSVEPDIANTDDPEIKMYYENAPTITENVKQESKAIILGLHSSIKRYKNYTEVARDLFYKENSNEGLYFPFYAWSFLTELGHKKYKNEKLSFEYSNRSVDKQKKYFLSNKKDTIAPQFTITGTANIIPLIVALFDTYTFRAKDIEFKGYNIGNLDLMLMPIKNGYSVGVMHSKNLKKNKTGLSGLFYSLAGLFTSESVSANYSAGIQHSYGLDAKLSYIHDLYTKETKKQSLLLNSSYKPITPEYNDEDITSYKQIFPILLKLQLSKSGELKKPYSTFNVTGALETDFQNPYANFGIGAGRSGDITEDGAYQATRYNEEIYTDWYLSIPVRILEKWNSISPEFASKLKKAGWRTGISWQGSVRNGILFKPESKSFFAKAVSTINTDDINKDELSFFERVLFAYKNSLDKSPEIQKTLWSKKQESDILKNKANVTNEGLSNLPKNREYQEKFKLRAENMKTRAERMDKEFGFEKNE